MASGEIDVEPSDESVDKIVASAVEHEGGLKGEVCGCAGIEVEGEDGGGVGYYSFDFDGVDERFGESGVFEGAVVEAVHVVPD